MSIEPGQVVTTSKGEVGVVTEGLHKVGPCRGRVIVMFLGADNPAAVPPEYLTPVTITSIEAVSPEGPITITRKQ